MLGILLAGISSAFDEIAFSIGKKRVSDGLESYYTFGFLTHFLSALFITAIGFLLSDLYFTPESLKTFIPRLVIAIIMLQIAVIAIAKVDRGSFGFIRLMTIPFLLIADLLLGYPLASLQILGIALIMLPIGFLFYSDFSQKKGMILALIVALLAALDLTLYKYDITHFNSVESEQAITALIVSLYFFLTAVLIRRENPLGFLRQKVYALQASSSGIAYVASSFAYFYAPASVIMAAFRGFSVLFAIVSGAFFFKEAHFILRIGLFLAVAAGLVLLVI